MEIGEPALLAKLPRAGLSEEGLRRFSQVYGVRNGTSKKRHEICAAVDGNSLNVFEIVNGRNLVSWPIPPDSSFISEPYSERESLSKDTYVRRCWCAVERKGKTSIQYFEQLNSAGKSTTSTKNHVLKSPKAPILEVEPINISERKVVVAQRDGNVEYLQSSSDSGHQSCKLITNASTIRIHAIQSMSTREAGTSVLKGRPDITSVLQNDQVIVAALYEKDIVSTETSKDLFLGIWTLGARLPAGNQGIEPMVVHNISISGKFEAKSALKASFRHAATRLELRDARTITTFDLTTAYPQKTKERKALMLDQTPSIDLTSEIRLVINPGKLQIFNSRYSSLLATTAMGDKSTKRKRDSPDVNHLSFIAYFSQIRRVVAYSGSQLLSIDIYANDPSQNPFKQSSLLSGNMLRGASEKPEVSHNTADLGPDWPQALKELERLAKSQNSEGFESRVRQLLSLDSWEDLKKLKKPQVDFILSQLFQIERSVGSDKLHLRLALQAQELVRWGIRAGLLDDYRIFKTLGADTTLFESGLVFQSLLQADPTLALLEEYIKHTPYLQPSVLTLIIKLLINRALRSSEIESKQIGSVDPDIEMQAPTGTKEMVQKPIGVQSQGATSMTCLLHALKRYAFLGPSLVSSQMRLSFGQKEILALIQLLRQQLFLGGYTRSADARNYPSPPGSLIEGSEVGPSSSQQMQLGSIVTLLNGCIDSLGMVGILGSKEDQDFIEKMVPELYSEIESATKGVEDSTYLHGLLRETLRYAESVERQPFEVRSKVEKSSNMQSKKGTIVTLYAEKDSQEPGMQASTALPLSLKAEEDLSKQKVRKGGQVHLRSAREMGMLKDRLKASYSFERLVL